MRSATRVRGTGLRPTRLRFARGRANAPGPVTFPATDLHVAVRIALGADLTASPLTWNWLDISGRVRHRDAIRIIAGRRDWAARTDTSTARLRIDNGGGSFSRRNPVGDYFGLLTRNTPIWISVDPGSGEVDRFTGYVNEWPVRWTDKSGVDSTVPIVCAGVMRRLEKAPDLPAALDRSYLAAGPVAFWRLDDGDDATSFASALPGGNRAVVERSTVAFASAAGPAGARGPVASLTGGGRIGMYPVGVSSTAWRVEWILNTAETQNGQPIEIRLPGTVTWIKVFVPWSGDPTLIVQGVDPTNTVSYFDVSHAFGSLAAYENIWHHVALTAEQSGADITWKLYVNGVLSQTDTTSTQTLSTIKSIAANSMIFNESISGSVAYVAVFNNADAPTTADAVDGYAGEQAHVRIARLCAEGNISCVITGGTSVELGPQPAGKMLNAVREAADVDHGYLYEVAWGLGYITRSTRLNAPVALALDFSSRHIAETPEPADDDRAIINRWAASRSGGSSATAEDAASIAADGLYDGGRDVNVETDGQLIQEAGLRVGLGTVDEDLWPHLTIRLHGTPDLIPAWIATRLGDHMTVAHQPSQVDPNMIDAVIEGWVETVDTKTWEVVLNTSPGSPLEAFQLESTSDNRGRLGTRESTLGAQLASGATTATITTTADKRPWITTASHPAQFPFDIKIGGERITVGSISNIADDNFNNRTVSNDFGTSSGGQVWTVDAAAPGDFAVAGGFGEITNNTVNALRYASMAIVSPVIDVMVNVRLPSIGSASGANISNRLLWGTDLSNHYEANMQLTTSGTLTLTLSKRLLGAGSTLVSAVPVDTYAANQIGWMRLRVLPGGVIQAWAWNVNATNVMATVSAEDTDITDGQLVAVGNRREAGNTDVAALVRWDTFTVNNPQTATITRTLAKAHGAGAPVTQWRPPHLALKGRPS